ncbi:DUF4359 domain-containing protein [Pseudoneobacillus sp. C159]
MKAKVVLSLILLFSAILLAILSNPTERQYISWLKEELKTNTHQPVDQEIEVFSPTLLETKTANYFLFSIYQTELENGGTQKTLGLLNNFFVIK